MIVRMSGGLGNQMFQYALKKELDIKYPMIENKIDISFYSQNCIHNGFELMKIFSIEDKYYDNKKIPPSKKNRVIYKVIHKLGITKHKTKKYFVELEVGYHTKIINESNSEYYLDGYWQSEEYFKSASKEIRDIFKFPEFDEEKNCDIFNVIKNENSISLHVRRGDYLNASDYICLGQTNYYREAINTINRKINNPRFIVFSDDINWCKNNLKLKENTIFVDWNNDEKSFRDMQLMSLCKHNIIANSTFSWWGAWLNSNNNKVVITPSKFFYNDHKKYRKIIPSNWVKIEV